MEQISPSDDEFGMVGPEMGPLQGYQVHLTISKSPIHRDPRDPRAFRNADQYNIQALTPYVTLSSSVPASLQAAHPQPSSPLR